ncbi:uncharacterized protein LOC131874014 [Cryptomeria japonica]|uniref:uncharacterized protein LOC131874014 n=1 Tax=Cryptomeria japonica TaxID=3369 RepID=UPI0027DA8400|nr:uncharacterized protein LOC131874014 [Cryptomeria japonica]
MDFITMLPWAQRKDCVYVVVDTLTKFAHLFAITNSFTAAQVVDVFFQEVFRLHGLPKNIQNPSCEGYDAAKSGHFEVSKGQSPACTESAKVDADQQWIERTFEVGDMVYLRLQPYRQSALKKSGVEKLKPRFYGPFKVIRRVGEVVYELELPASSKIHNVFHVSRLKKVLIPEAIHDFREHSLRRRVIKEYLIKWKNLLAEDATWENEEILLHSTLQLLEDRQFWEGRTVMSPSQ